MDIKGFKSKDGTVHQYNYEALANKPATPGSGGNVDHAAVSRVIDLKKYGITTTETDLEATTENYHICHANAVGINQAIQDAIAAGWQELIFPEGNYPLCYEGDAESSSNRIIDAQGISLTASGKVRLYIVYDDLDTGLNPYYTADPSTGHTLMGKIMVVDRDVNGFEMVGERALRKHENTKFREFSGGIVFGKHANGKIKNCRIHHFSGDGIGGWDIEQLASWPDDTFISKTFDGSEFVDSKTSYMSTKHGADWIDKTKPMIITGTGFTYFLYRTAPLKIHCFDADEKFIGTVINNQSEPFYFPPNTGYWYIELVRNVEHDVTATETNTYRLASCSARNVVIENCEVAFNQRGGISNVPTGSIIQSCEIHHNGGAYDGMPAFADGTQFGIDIEDQWIHNLTIKDCLIHNNLHGLLYRCHGINIIDSVIYGITNSLNFGINFFAQNTRFDSCTMDYPTPFGSKTAIGCTFNGKVDPSINIVGKSIAGATLSSENTNIVEFKDAGGNVLFTLDLTMIGKEPGGSVIMDSLLFNGDMTKFTADTLTLDDETGNMSMTATASLVREGGLSSAGGGTTAVSCTWKNPVTINQNMAVELFYTGGYPMNPWNNLATCGTTAGDKIPSTESDKVYVRGCDTEYVNTSGSTVKAKNEGSWNVYNDEGVAVSMSAKTLPDAHVMDFGHYVINLKEDGTSEVYRNGYLATAPACVTTDFAQWDFTNYETAFKMWGGQDYDDVFRLRSARMYNRCLTKDEIRNNLDYEAKKLGY